jgi:hypothetical protein
MEFLMQVAYIILSASKMFLTSNWIQINLIGLDNELY